MLLDEEVVGYFEGLGSFERAVGYEIKVEL
jgi:hypothetical protein